MARPFSQVSTGVQWEACALEDVRLRGDAVELAWTSTPGEADPDAVVPARGLAFDRGCRLLRRRLGGEELERVLWERRRDADAALFRLLACPPDEGGGDFVPEPEAVSFGEVRGLAVDAGDRLFVAEEGRSEVAVFDLWSRTRVRSISTAPDLPVDLAAHGADVFVALDGATTLLRTSARGPSVRLELPDGVDGVGRIAASASGWLAVITDPGSASARLALVRPETDSPGRRVDGLAAGPSVAVPWAGDCAFEDDGGLVVARTPGAEFLRFRLAGASLVEDRPLRARGYDGGGIATSPDGGIAYWGDVGPRPALDAPVRHAPRGTVLATRLDSGTFQSRWGRLFVDVVLPVDTRVRVRCATHDDEGADPGFSAADPFLPLHCRDGGRELPYADTPGPSSPATLEAPVVAGPGRYLRVELLLEGNTRVSPRLRALRVEEADHDHLQRLPRAFSRDPEGAAFLRRYLGPMAGFLQELDDRSLERHRLLVPETAPSEVLPWLAGFLGLALDDRWPERTRRTLIDEANELFRRRGTLGSLKRFLELYVEAPVHLVEHFRLRGLGGGFLRREGEASSTSILGGGFRVGGSIGSPGRTTTEALGVSGGGGADERASDGYAHRFTVLVGRALTEEQLQVVRRILAVHRPAHTVVDDICEVGAGMRVGRGLHTGLSSFVGPTGGFRVSQVGDVVLGRDAMLGRPSGDPC